jgi:NTP pyrophosphatase (non-canonical NTP hydrolase)
MERLVDKIKQLYRDNAYHRKGFYIRDATPSLAAANSVAELGEYLTAKALGDEREAKVELADVLAVVTHLILMEEDDMTVDNGAMGLDAIIDRAISKLNQRFSCVPRK